MRQAKKFGVLLLALALTLITACSSNNNNDASNKGDSSPKASASQSASTSPSASASARAETIDPFGKFDPPITLNVPMSQDSTVKYKAGESQEKNVWFDAFKNQLGIDVKIPWSIDSSKYEERSNVIIASGSIPDMMAVNAVQLKRLSDAGMIEDLTEVYDKYATPEVKAILDSESGLAFNTAKVNGKVMAIPAVNGSIGTLNMLHVRKDWLDHLGLQAPKTMQDVLAIAKAFTHDDPDGNGKPDTFGLGITKNLYGGWAEIYSFANSYHVYPKTWVKDGSGKLVYGSVQPGMRDVLLKLQEMYRDGQINREFSVMGTPELNKDITSGKVGLLYGKQWNPIFPFNDNVKNDPKADWISFPLLSIDQEPAKPQTSVNVSAYYVVKKGYEHPEALVKILNLFVKQHNENPDEYWTTQIKDKDGKELKLEMFKYSPFQLSSTNENIVAYLKVNDKLAGKDVQLTVAEQSTFDQVKQYMDTKDVALWGAYKIFGPNGTQGILHQYEQNNLYMFNEFYGAPTKTMVSNLTSLETMEQEVFSKIIMGDKIEEFDNFVKKWGDLGGTEITKEVNDWNAQK